MLMRVLPYVFGSMICRTCALTLDSAYQINHAREPKCEMFLILTMQRSGSTWLAHQLNKRVQFHVSHEGFNLGNLGGVVAHQLGLQPAAIRRMGAKKFALKVFDYLAKEATPPCQVGFAMMGTSADMFTHNETLGLLEKWVIRKVLLKRENTSEQWISHETACWFGDFSPHSTRSDHIEHLKEARERLQRGETCDGRSLEKFQRKKDAQYSEWMTALGDQPRIELTTEKLDHQINDLVSQLRDIAGIPAKEEKVAGDTFDILTDDA